MNYRTLGKTGMRISEIGFGGWAIGKSSWVGAEDNESLRALNLAVDRGLNFIDTAMGYGDGHSETLVGQLVKSRSERIYIATKLSPINKKWPAVRGSHVNDGFTARHIIACTEARAVSSPKCKKCSMMLLKVERIRCKQLSGALEAERFARPSV